MIVLGSLLTGVKTFDDGCCVYEISSAQHAHEMRVEFSNLYPGRPMHLVREEQQTCAQNTKGTSQKQCVHGRRGEGRRGHQRGCRFLRRNADHLEKAAVCLTVLKQHHLLC